MYRNFVKHVMSVKSVGVSLYDRVPITPIPRHESVFQVWVTDCLGPLLPNQNVKYNYALVLSDSCSRFPVAFTLTSLAAKNVCKALLQLFQFTRIPSVILSDMASNCNSQLTKTFLSMLGCTPRFNVPGRRQQSGLCDKHNENDSPSDLSASDERSVASTTLIAEQQEDKSLDICSKVCKQGQGWIFF